MIMIQEIPIQHSFVKCFHFTDEADIIELSCSSSDSLCSDSDQHVCSDSCLNVKLNEILDPDFGLYVWPCAPVLSKYIWTCRKKLRGKNVIELGAGTGLPSIVAAKCGAKVILTDSLKNKYVLKLGKFNMLSNYISENLFKVVELTWGKFSPFLVDLKDIDLILGSDVFYNLSDIDDVLATVSFILKRNPTAEFWCSYEHRCSDWNVNHLLQKWDLKCKEVSLNSFGADKFNVAGSDLPGLKTISLYKFKYFSAEFS